MRSKRKRSRHNIAKKRLKKNVFVLFFCVALLLMGVAYAAYKTENKLSPIGKIYQDDSVMKIKSVSTSPNTICGYEMLETMFDNESITFNVELPELSCVLVYDVVIVNKTEDDMVITDIVGEDYNNSDILYEILGVGIGDTILSGETITATLSIKYDSNVSDIVNNVFSVIIEFSWEIQEDDVLVARINYSETSWTNQDVIATLSFNKPSIVITNNNGSNQYVFEQNDAFTFTYLNQLGLPETTVATVTWIDKLDPMPFVPSVSIITENSITLGGTTTDVGGSGVCSNCYYYSSDEGNTWMGPFGTSYTITGLTADTAYMLKMKAVDRAGNETESYTVLARTDSTNSTGLPIIVNPDEDGQYFSFTNFPAGINYVGDHYDGDTFTFVLAKPQSTSNSGNNTFSFTLPIINGSAYQWTAGQVNAAIGTGVFNKVEPSLSNTIVNSGASVNVVHSIMSKIDVGSTDDVRITISFMVNGVRRNLYVDFWWIPYDSYAVFFDSNGGTGNMKAKICTATATCAITTNAYTNPGKIFAGWSTSPDGPVVYNNSANIVANTYGIGSKVVLYAKWN